MKSDCGNLVNPDVVIIGDCLFHNQLFQDFIENRLKLQCVCGNMQRISFTSEVAQSGKKLLFWDCLGLTPDEIRARFSRCFSKELEQYQIVFYNMLPTLDLESEALAHGVRGIFYMKDTLDKVEKGIQAVLKNELWFSRANISSYLNNSLQKAKHQSDGNPASLLTPREKQILSMIAIGSNNRKIAEDLYISPHTVKTHLNNIFGKIKVSDRVQAMLWAICHL